LKKTKTTPKYAHPAPRELALSTVLQALAEPGRLEIVRAIAASPTGELACNEIPLDLSKATRSHHFSVLRDAGIIFTRVDGTRSMTCVRQTLLNERFPGLLDLVLAPRRPK
jgi:DNA-binding transcriptional ArsR family regulator